jgi:uncharacterized protein YdaU (DUF1376 family)
MNYYHRYPGHYIAKTLHLSMEEDGAYTRLLDWMYLNERPVPHEERYAIARAMKASERKAVDKVLAQYFTALTCAREDGLSKLNYENSRVNSEIAKNAPRIQAARENGRNGGRPRKTETQEKPNGFQNENPVGFSEKPRAKAPQTPNTSITPDRSSLAERSQGDQPSSERAQEPDALAPWPQPSPAVIACKLMRKAGCPLQLLNSHHPDLLAGLAEGVTPEAYAETVREGIAKGKDNPFAWAVATARARHAQGARTPATTNHGTTSHGQPHLSLADRAAAAHAARGSEPEARASLAVIDGSASRIAR